MVSVSVTMTSSDTTSGGTWMVLVSKCSDMMLLLNMGGACWMVSVSVIMTLSDTTSGGTWMVLVVIL